MNRFGYLKVGLAGSHRQNKAAGILILTSIYQAVQIFHRDAGLFCLPGSIFDALTKILRRCRADLQSWLAALKQQKKCF
jgi:hypothetical protein